MNREKIIIKVPELRELYENLAKLKTTIDEEFIQQFKRSLPFADLLFDRWERAKTLGFGTGSSIYDSSLIFGEVKVGNNTWVGPHTILDGSGGLVIGSFCSVSAGVQIYSHDSVAWAISGGKEEYKYAKTQIGNNCYIGPNVIISSGVTIGDGSIIGANSFVNCSFPEKSKIAGNPAKSISHSG